MDKVRVLRIIEYVGPRDAIEKQLERSVHGTRTWGPPGREIQIRATTIGSFPEILDREPAFRVDDVMGGELRDHMGRTLPEFYASLPEETRAGDPNV